MPTGGGCLAGTSGEAAPCGWQAFMRGGWHMLTALALCIQRVHASSQACVHPAQCLSACPSHTPQRLSSPTPLPTHPTPTPAGAAGSRWTSPARSTTCTQPHTHTLMSRPATSCCRGTSPPSWQTWALPGGAERRFSGAGAVAGQAAWASGCQPAAAACRWPAACSGALCSLRKVALPVLRPADGAEPARLPPHFCQRRLHPWPLSACCLPACLCRRLQGHAGHPPLHRGPHRHL